ncbi:EIN3-binding F-box protein 1 isoform X1 [Cryptomeria japonica]|uniref:EIN3-binding F-box protein 1 isoform X1 n=1 Tax=Cryptomeria japonica TaxID=3369 RepID=UPI0027DA510E|nr:EIN3-binding F-box protein 1 isoform X1 [Cryptomeria japonica]
MGKRRRKNAGEVMDSAEILPDDVLLAIFSHISTRDLLSRLALVCKRWLRLVKSQSVKELLPSVLCCYNCPWASLREEDFLKLWSCYSNCLEKVSLNGYKLGVDRVVSLIASCPNLKDLSVVSCPSLVPFYLEIIANILPVHLVNLDFHVDSQFHLKLPALFDRVLDAVSHRCPHLQKLDLDSCIQVSRDCLFRFLDLKMSIKSLNLCCDTVGWPELANIFVSLKHLEHLSIVSSKLNESADTSDEEDYLLDRRRMRSRMRLRNVEYASSLSDFKSYVTSFPCRLSSLRLYHSPHHSVSFTSAPSIALLKSLGHQIHHLHAQNVFNGGWHSISVWCAGLETLDLSHAKNKDLQLTGIEEVILCGLPRLLRNLKRIALPFVFDDVLVELGQFCPKLKELRFEGFSCKISKSTKKHLVTDRGVIAITEGCSELEVLSLSGCNKVTDSAIRELAFRCRKLKILHLSSCKKLTDIGVTILLQQLHGSLCLLDLVGCKNITKDIITSLSLLKEDQGFNIQVLAISKRLWASSEAELMKLKMCAPNLSVRVGSCKIIWDGFYHLRTW